MTSVFEVDQVGLDKALQAVQEAEAEQQARIVELEAKAHIAATLRKQKASELAGLLQELFESEEGNRLKVALEQMKLKELRLSNSPVHYLRLHSEKNWQWIIVHCSGGYFSNRSETVHSTEGLADLLTSYWPEKSVADHYKSVVQAVKQALKEKEHCFRYRNDPEYRAIMDKKEAAELRKQRIEVLLWAGSLSLLIAGFIIY